MMADTLPLYTGVALRFAACCELRLKHPFHTHSLLPVFAGKSILDHQQVQLL